MADFSTVKADECVRKKMPEGCRMNASHTFVLQSVINEIKAHGRSSMRHEVCGVLLGNLCFDGEPYLLIDARIEGKYATCLSGSVTFTSETWDYINSERDAKFADKKIVGWYHTHPGFGIFLSNMDVFIHENFFPMKWQPAYVFDPQAETDGFFFAKGDSPEQESVVIVPDEPAREVDGKTSPNAEKITGLTAEDENRLENRRFLIIASSAVLGLALVLNVWGFLVFRDQLAKRDEALAEKTRQVRVLEKKCEELISAAEELERSKSGATNTAAKVANPPKGLKEVQETNPGQEQEPPRSWYRRVVRIIFFWFFWK